jgi:ankyrin repeat protein
MWAVYSDNNKAVEAFIKAGANVNKENMIGNTALTYAVEYDNFEAVTTLIEAGAKVNKSDIDLAKEKEDLELVKILKQAEKRQKIEENKNNLRNKGKKTSASALNKVNPNGGR